jgi:hypothetical protein
MELPEEVLSGLAALCDTKKFVESSFTQLIDACLSILTQHADDSLLTCMPYIRICLF